MLKNSLLKSSACLLLTLGLPSLSYAKPFTVEGDQAIKAQQTMLTLINYGLSREKAGRVVKALFLYHHTLCGMVGATIVSLNTMSGSGKSDDFAEAGVL